MVLSIEELLRNKDHQKQIRRAIVSINECLQVRSKKANRETVIAAYTLYKAKAVDIFTYQDNWGGQWSISGDIAKVIERVISEKTWAPLAELLPQYTADIFAAVVFWPICENADTEILATPDSVIKLAQAILQCSPGERIADIGCGTAAFMASAALAEPRAKYFGYEINAESFVIAKMRAELLDADIQIYLQDAFALPAVMGQAEKFDKIFSNYPFGLKPRDLGGDAEVYLKKLKEQCPEISRASSDWVFNLLLCDLVQDEGKAIGIMASGSAWNHMDMPIRRYFVERGLIECVIALPSRLFTTTNIPTSLIVLSHGNRSVRLIDAENICQQGRRQNEFSAEDIQIIAAAQTLDSLYSRVIGLEELRENEYNLSLSCYSDDGIEWENGVLFEEIIKSITRGAPCTASQLDEMVSDQVTDLQYLMLSNIQEGVIEENLPYLAAMDPKYEKYCLKNNSLLISKNGYPYKIAVARVKEGQRILANGNLYIIEIDEKKADPYYLKAFFESKQGMAALKKISVGTTIANIGVDKLKKLVIPLPSMEKQEQIAQNYQETLDQIADLKRQLEEAVNRLQYTFDAASEEQQASSSV